MNSDEKQKGNAELEQNAQPKRHRFLLAITSAPFATMLANADLMDGVDKQRKSNKDFYHFAIGGAHPYSLKSISRAIHHVASGSSNTDGHQCEVGTFDASIEREFDLIRSS